MTLQPNLIVSSLSNLASVRIDRTISSVVADYYLIHEKHVFSNSRKKEHVRARRMVMLLLWETGLSWMSIGVILRRHHSTVMDQVKKLKAFIDIYPDVEIDYLLIKSRLNRGISNELHLEEI